MRIHLLLVYGLVILLGILVGFIGSVFELLVEQGEIYIELFFDYAKTGGIFMILISFLIIITMSLIAWALVHYVAPEASGSGVPQIEGTLLHEQPIFWKRLLGVKFLGGVLALSSKMVLGREGPTIQIGGNLAEMLSEFFNLKQHRRDALIAAGAAAGLATAFNAPLAGVVFIIEEMRNAFNFSFTNFKMVAICCVAATIVNRFIMGSQPAIEMAVFHLPTLSSLVAFFGFGVIVGFAGIVFNYTLMKSISFTAKLNTKWQVIYVVFVSVLVGVLLYFFPGGVGGGYSIIERSLSLRPTFVVLEVLIVIRFFMTMLCYSTRVPGGIFAPMLALGTLIGLSFSYLFEMVFGQMLHPGMFAVAGMGGLFSAAVRAPITGIILVVEMTHNYYLILPLMVTCLTSTTVVQLFNNPPIYTQLLRRLLNHSEV